MSVVGVVVASLEAGAADEVDALARHDVRCENVLGEVVGRQLGARQQRGDRRQVAGQGRLDARHRYPLAHPSAASKAATRP